MPGGSSNPCHPFWQYWLLHLPWEAIISCLGPPCNDLCIPEVSWASHQPGESQWSPCPPVPLTLYHPPLILLPNCPPSISHHSIHKSTHYHSLCTPSAPQLHPSLPCSLPLHFSLFFGTIYGCPLLLMPFPTFLHHIGLFSHTTCPLHYPSHPLPLPAPLPTHFWGAMSC